MNLANWIYIDANRNCIHHKKSSLIVTSNAEMFTIHAAC